MSQPYKTITRDKISGQWRPIDLPLGKGNDYGQEIVKRNEQQNEELLKAIAKDDTTDMVSGGVSHPATDIAIKRMDPLPEGLYRAVNGDDPNA